MLPKRVTKTEEQRIIVLPKLDQFYTMIEEGLKYSTIN